MGGFVKLIFIQYFRTSAFLREETDREHTYSNTQDIQHISYIHHSMGVHMWKDVSLNQEGKRCSNLLVFFIMFCWVRLNPTTTRPAKVIRFLLCWHRCLTFCRAVPNTSSLKARTHNCSHSTRVSISCQSYLTCAAIRLPDFQPAANIRAF